MNASSALASLSLNLRPSPYADSCPPLLRQLMQMKLRSEEFDREVRPQAKPIIPQGPVISLSVEHLQRGIVTPTVSNPNSNTLNLPSTLGVQSISSVVASPIKEGGTSPTTSASIRRKGGPSSPPMVTETMSDEDAFRQKHLRATAEFNDNNTLIGKSQLSQKHYSQLTKEGYNNSTNPRFTDASPSVIARYPNAGVSDSHFMSPYDGASSEGFRSVSGVDATAATADGLSIIQGGAHSTMMVEEDIVLGLTDGGAAAVSMPTPILGRGSSNGTSYQVGDGGRSSSQFNQYSFSESHNPPLPSPTLVARSHQLHPIATIQQIASSTSIARPSDAIDDDDDFPLLSPMDQSKVASPSHGGPVSSSPPFPQQGVGRTYSGSLSPVTAQKVAAEHEQLHPLHVAHRSAAAQQEPMYAEYITSLENKIKEEAAKAAALEFQAMRARFQNQNTMGSTNVNAYVNNVDELRLREDFARELYFLKRQIEELKNKPPAAEAERLRHQTPPPHPMRRREGSQSYLSFRSSAGHSPTKVINVKVVKAYEDEPVPYVKTKRQPPAPSVAYTNSFYSESPSPPSTKHKKDKGKKNRFAESSIASSYQDNSFISESIASFVSESVD